MLTGTADLTDFSLIDDWVTTTETGDRPNCRTLRADSKLWPQVDARRETCSGKECEFFDRCYVTRMHQRAREADLIVVNHHLFFADLALSKDDFGAIIPHHQAVVFDEAHEIESVIGQFFRRQPEQFPVGRTCPGHAKCRLPRASSDPRIGSGC